jgi:ABC-type nickel/cobalt efflux system permease component RcnA
MTSLLSIVLLGFFLGMRHATDPDHVIAVTTIVARQPQRGGAAIIGAVWGIGHTLTILVVGAGIILLGWAIPPRVGLSLELAVGVMLIALGFMNIVGTGPEVTESAAAGSHDHQGAHVHAHPHGDYVHTHAHEHDPESHPHRPDQTPLARLDRRFGSIGAYQLVRPLVVGVVHGLAGSAAVALLVLTTIRDPRWAVLYLFLFGLGTVAGMMLISAALAWPFARAGARFASLHRGLRLASGIVSLIFGAVIAYKIGIVDGLFGSAPTWTPR